MSSWLSLVGRGARKDGEGGEEEHKASADAPAAAPQPALDPDEVRWVVQAVYACVVACMHAPVDRSVD